MDLPDYNPQQPLVYNPGRYREDLLSLEGPSTSPELKTEPDGRPESEESCPICGDKVSGYHYGLLTCESCKGFFKRSVQNNKLYTCVEHQKCPMNLSQRKRCPFCRFQKCLAVGMKREAVRADRMRGGRNKFGPLYRRDRQMKQQKVFHHPLNAPYWMKMESTQTQRPTAPHDPHLMRNNPTAPLSFDALHHSHVHPPAVGHPGAPVPLDCNLNADRGLAPLSLPYSGLYHRSFPGYLQEKGEMPYGYSSATTNYQISDNSFTARSTPASSPCSTPSSSTRTPDAPSSAPLKPNFLDHLLEGEQDEGQLCAKVLASLQREQANRGKHDRLNTFSIMCKMADQTLFGLVEWARNSALFKELKIEVMTIVSQAGVTLSSLVSRTQDLVSKLKAFQLDRHEFVCLKHLVLFNPDVKSVQSRAQVEQTQERVNRALMEHTQQSHPRHSDKFGQLLLRLPEVRSISLQVEEYLYQRHLLGDLPCNSLLTEMLHTKHS
ncbi:Nuclear receptor subfamily 5 group A member 2 [Liparis tanakae]|uniref:Nuclear receptor subfamily 5 group A member 2 n=1 Tax=Liparis tanakae TaxID=230148 RepID=A0A4Z2FRD1_9TELE|nr:Nuclear receptor subfamily 5 group A member 2 [Liparis tanakae]